MDESVLVGQFESHQSIRGVATRFVGTADQLSSASVLPHFRVASVCAQPNQQASDQAPGESN
jgi:hypothetical protein